MRSSLPFSLWSSLVLITAVIPWPADGGQDGESKPAGGTSPARAGGEALVEDLLAAHNKVRAAEKRPPLALDSRLTRAAQAHARDMAEHDKLSHEGSDGSDPKTRIKRTDYHYKQIGENVASGQETVGEVMRSWIESPHHRENILGDFTQMGGAVAKASDGRMFWCVDFGRPMAAVDPAKSPREMLAALNRARSEAGKKALRLDPQLDRVAARFAKVSAERKKLETKDPEGRTPFQLLQGDGFRARRFGMVLASGEGDAAKVVAAWLKEPRDREALMSGFERAGIGVSTDSEGVPYWVLLLAQGMNQ